MGAAKLDHEWWSERPDTVVGPEVMAFVRSLLRESKSPEGHEVIKKFDAATFRKTIYLFRGFFLLYALNVLFDLGLARFSTPIWKLSGPLRFDATWTIAILLTATSLALKLVTMRKLGMFWIPLTRLFMHSQMHWKFGASKFQNFILDHGIGLIFSLPQTSYAVGHRFHHKFDNDWAPNGLPNDLQSTFMFSKTEEPISIRLWAPYYMFIFQLILTPYWVYKHGTKREKFWFPFEQALIIGFHYFLFRLDPQCYFIIYIPALLLAWFNSSLALYMMHAVRADEYALHPTNNCHHNAFNSFGDNDGYHLEHSLFAAIHPIHLPALHEKLKDRYSSEQISTEFYHISGFRRFVRGE